MLSIDRPWPRHIVKTDSITGNRITRRRRRDVRRHLGYRAAQEAAAG